jgi:hypothetical protein
MAPVGKEELSENILAVVELRAIASGLLPGRSLGRLRALTAGNIAPHSQFRVRPTLTLRTMIAMMKMSTIDVAV